MSSNSPPTANFVNKDPKGTYVDVHCHLIHHKFLGIEDEIAEKCATAGLEYIVVNGLEPKSNRAVIELCSRHDNCIPACGIYPLDAACNFITEGNWGADGKPPEKFDVDAEIDWIDQVGI